MIKQTKHGWMDFSDLPKTTDGKIDWSNPMGCVIPFKYDDITSRCVINKVLPNKYFDISIDGYVDSYVIQYNNLSYGKFGYALQKLSTNFLFDIGDVINNSLLITSQYRENGRRRYGYLCTKDGYVGSIDEQRAKYGDGCPACSGRIAIRGQTDVATTHPHIANLFWNEEDTHLYLAFSREKVDFKCPCCGNKINARISNVTTFGLSCKKCGDGVSYPEKFVFNVLEQAFKLHPSSLGKYMFKTQKTFDWSKNILHNNTKISGDKIYDFYLQIHNDVLIETHGPQHFERGFYIAAQHTRTLEEEQENDRIKYNIALQNGILPENYIVLDCRYSTVQHIKKSIMQSSLPQLLGFTEDQIDWCKCGIFAESSRVFEACQLWNNGIRSTRRVAIEMKINRATALRYLRRGEELGIVQDPPKHKKKTQQND